MNYVEQETILKEILNVLKLHGEQMNNRFEQMDSRFEQLENKFDQRFDRLEKKVDGIRVELTET